MLYDPVKYQVSSLQSICIEYAANNLCCLLSQMNIICRLPSRVKDRILHKICVSLHFWKEINVKVIWKSLIHRQTKQVNLTFCLVDDDILSTLKVCQNLKELHMNQILNNSLTTEGLLGLFPHLKELCIITLSKCTAVNDEVVISIARNCKNLVGLDLHSCIDITDKALHELSHLENLLWITLSNTKVADSGIEALVSGPSGHKLKELRLADCPNVTGKILPVIISNCSDLEVFAFHGCKMIQGTQLMDLKPKGLKQIQYTIEW